MRTRCEAVGGSPTLPTMFSSSPPYTGPCGHLCLMGKYQERESTLVSSSVYIGMLHRCQRGQHRHVDGAVTALD
jgi:hypothetical protein